MSEGSDVRIGLSAFLAQLVAELSKALTQLEKDNLNYSVDEVTLDLDVAYTITQSADTPAKVKTEFWVLGSGSRDAEDKLPLAQSNMQHLILRLTPRLEDVEAGESEYVGTISRMPPKRLADEE
jgi:hypothetical protein